MRSDGAKVLFPTGFETPLIIQKRDGGFGYDSTDMTALKYRIQEMKADWIIYVVDSGQALHFQQVFQAARDGRLGRRRAPGPRGLRRRAGRGQEEVQDARRQERLSMNTV